MGTGAADRGGGLEPGLVGAGADGPGPHALDYGIQAAEQFLAIYRTLTAGTVQHHPYWDVVTVIDLIGDIDPDDPLPSDDLAALETYVAAALTHL